MVSTLTDRLFRKAGKPAPIDLEAAERALEEARTSYAGGAGSWAKLQDAERVLEEARAAKASAKVAEMSEAARAEAEARAAAEAAAESERRGADQKRRGIALAVARRRLEELRAHEIELVTDADDEDVLAIVRAFGRLARAVTDRTTKRAELELERADLTEAIAALERGEDPPALAPNPGRIAHVAGNHAMAASTEIASRIAAAMGAASRAIPGLGGYTFSSRLCDSTDPAKVRRYALALGAEREPTRRERSEIEAAERGVREAEERAKRASEALIKYRAGVVESRELWRPEHRTLEDKANEANVAAHAAREQLTNVRARIEAACRNPMVTL